MALKLFTLLCENLQRNSRKTKKKSQVIKHSKIVLSTSEELKLDK